MKNFYLIEICQGNREGSGLFLIETGINAFIFLGSTCHTQAKKFYDHQKAESFIRAFPVHRQRFLRVTPYQKKAA